MLEYDPRQPCGGPPQAYSTFTSSRTAAQPSSTPSVPRTSYASSSPWSASPAAPDCMQVVAGHLTEDDVKAVAAVLASKPAPDKPEPVAKGSYALPFACGSQPQ